MTHRKQHSVCMPNSKQQGFTLVEFMVASVLGLVVIAGAGSLYSYTKRLNDVGMARVTTLQDLRTAATLITQDSRSAGVFGCANLGRRWAPDGSNCEVALQNVDPTVLTAGASMGEIIQLRTLDPIDGNKRSAGVRWVSANSVASQLSGIWNGVNFTPKSGALLFYYGEGSLSFNSSDAAAGTATFNTNEKNPNKVVSSVIEQGGWLVAAGCNTLAFKQSSGGTANTVQVTLPPGAVSTAANADATENPILPHSDMILQRYKIVAYVVGDITGEPETALYRFEFGNNGDSWSPPQKLAKNVTNMTAQYLFVTDCPSAKPDDTLTNPVAALNAQAFTVRNADDGNMIEDDKSVSPNNGKDDAVQGPSSIRLELTYDFPKIRGGAIETGGQGEKFYISAVVRGGNVCASRKIAQ